MKFEPLTLPSPLLGEGKLLRPHQLPACRAESFERAFVKGERVTIENAGMGLRGVGWKGYYEEV